MGDKLTQIFFGGARNLVCKLMHVISIFRVKRDWIIHKSTRTDVLGQAFLIFLYHQEVLMQFVIYDHMLECHSYQRMHGDAINSCCECTLILTRLDLARCRVS